MTLTGNVSQYVQGTDRLPDGPPANRSSGLSDHLRLTDDDRGEISLTLDGQEVRGWSYRDETERRAKMRAAWEYREGWAACERRMAAGFPE